MTTERSAPALRIGSLFSGIGGLDLGLERAGVGRPVWFCDVEPFALGILARRWPDVPQLPDVREVTPTTAAPIDVLCGGFPCQDISLAGSGAGLEGKRSGLFFEMIRVARQFTPRFIVFENVATIRARGLDTVLTELHAAGYDAAWSTFGADAVGAPHRRLRWWCVAYRHGEDRAPAMGSTWGLVGARGKPPAHGVMAGGRIAHGEAWGGASAPCEQWPTPTKWEGRQAQVSPGDLRRKSPGLRADAVLTDAVGYRVSVAKDANTIASAVRESGLTLNADWVDALMGFPVGWTTDADPQAWPGWPARPGWPQVAGEPPRTVQRGTQANRGKRISALGNAVVPQCAEVVGRKLLEIKGDD